MAKTPRKAKGLRGIQNDPKNLSEKEDLLRILINRQKKGKGNSKTKNREIKSEFR